MRSFLILTLVAVSICFSYTQLSFAVCSGGPTVFTCDDSPPNPDLMGIQEELNNANLIISVLPGAIINTTAASTIAIHTGNGNNQITLDQAEVLALETNGIETDDGNDTINVTDSTVRCDDDCIDTLGGDDVISIIRSTIASVDNNGIDATEGNNKITVIDSEVIGGPGTGNNYGIQGSPGNDMITVRNSLVFGESTGGRSRAMLLRGGDDMVRLETNARIDGFIDCGATTSMEDPSGTLIFAMDVPLQQLPIISAELASKDPREDSIVINGLLYEWEDCLNIVNELNGTNSIRPIPTLSEWGLIAMAGILGLVGFMFALRRRATQHA